MDTLYSVMIKKTHYATFFNQFITENMSNMDMLESTDLDLSNCCGVFHDEFDLKGPKSRATRNAMAKQVDGCQEWNAYT